MAGSTIPIVGVDMVLLLLVLMGSREVGMGKDINNNNNNRLIMVCFICLSIHPSITLHHSSHSFTPSPTKLPNPDPPPQSQLVQVVDQEPMVDNKVDIRADRKRMAGMDEAKAVTKEEEGGMVGIQADRVVMEARANMEARAMAGMRVAGGTTREVRVDTRVEVAAGLKEAMVGMREVVAGTREVVAGMEVATGGAKNKAGTKEVMAGTREVVAGTREVVADTKEVVAGTKVATGGAKSTAGTKVNTGVAKSKADTKEDMVVVKSTADMGKATTAGINKKRDRTITEEAECQSPTCLRIPPHSL